MLNKKRKDLAYEICKDFVEKEIPEEVEFYELVWKAFDRLPKNWERGMTERKIAEKRLTVLPETIGSLLTPLVIGIVSGILSRFFYDLIKKRVGSRGICEGTKRQINHMAIEIAINFDKKSSFGEKVALFVIQRFENIENEV